MKTLHKKIIKISGISIGIFLVSLVLGTLIINFFFRDRLINYVVSQLNEQVDAQIIIKNADITFWKTFPDVAIQFNQVIVKSSKNFLSENINTSYNDTLLISDKVFFEFNLFKLLTKKYILKQIHINNGKINLITGVSGISNYDIIKASEETSRSKASEINLRKVLITNSVITYKHLSSDVSLLTHAKKILINGTIEKKHINLLVKSDLFIDYVLVRGKSYLSKRRVKTNLPIDIKGNSIYKFLSSEVYISNIPIEFSGEFTSKPLKYINFSFLAKKVELSKVFAVLPPELKQKTRSYEADGKLDVSLIIKGKTENSNFPNIKIAFNLSNATITEQTSKIKLSGLEMDCIYSNGSLNNSKTSYLQINKLLSKIGTGEFSINGKIESLLNPKIQLSCFTLLKINDLKQFFKLDSIEILEGTAEGSFTISGTLDKLSDFKLADAKNLNYVGQVNIHEGSFKMAGSNFPISGINGLIKFSNDLYFNKLSFSLHDNKILLTGKMEQGIPYLFGISKNSFVEAELTSPNIDLSNYFVAGKTSEINGYSREFLFPDNISFDLKFAINEFKLNKFNAKYARGNLYYKPGMFIIKALTLETCEGKVSGNGAIIQDMQNNFLVKAQSEIIKLNIRQLFTTFNNFGQTVLKDNHLKGKVSGTINFTSVWNQNLRLLTDKLIVESDVTINNGELINFEPLLGLSRFIAVEELKNIKFSTLHNNILIKDKQIIIPQMDVQSSAFNITGSGIHKFNNKYNYKIKVLLSEFLYGKAKKAKKENAEYGYIEDDGLGKTSLYLSIDGEGKNYKITYDSRKTIDVVKEGFTRQKSELKEIFKEEFGWFKNDSTLHKQKTSNKISVEWEEDDNTTKKSDKKEDKKKVSGDKVQVEWE
jgi:hypothetical protein